jgi:hypothetical protein
MKKCDDKCFHGVSSFGLLVRRSFSAINVIVFAVFVVNFEVYIHFSLVDR